MKKALIASTALILSAGIAAADVKVSGYGRTGIIYYEDGALTGGNNDTQVISRLRMNLDASTTTDSGVDFGGRFRLQWDQNHGSRGESGALNAGKLWVSSQGLTVEVGNIDTAFDSTGLLGATELGAFDRSVARAKEGPFFAYESSPYSTADRLGVGATYAVDALTARLSYVDPSQRGDNEDGVGMEEEIGVSVDYDWNDRLELSAAYVTNGAGIDNNDMYFIGARYAVMDNARVGLSYFANDGDDKDDAGNTISLFGDYTLADGNTNIEAYVANNDGDNNETDTAFGIGVNYDLGGARLGASIQRDYQERVTADMGVRFNF